MRGYVVIALFFFILSVPAAFSLLIEDDTEDSFSFQGGWQTTGNSIDERWDANYDACRFTECFLYVNYTITLPVLWMNWTVKYGSDDGAIDYSGSCYNGSSWVILFDGQQFRPIEKTLIVPNSCFQNNPIQFRIRLYNIEDLQRNQGRLYEEKILYETSPICGNNVVEGTEQCDDGNINNNDSCKNDCTNNVCGDDYIYTGVEQCELPNTINNANCPQGVVGCVGNKTYTRDNLGNCNNNCRCVQDNLSSFQCVKDSCGALCTVDSECDDQDPNTLDTCNQNDCGCDHTLNCVDADQDGFAINGGSCGPIDCNDNDIKVFPGAKDYCDNKDNDCDGNVDEEFSCEGLCTPQYCTCATFDEFSNCLEAWASKMFNITWNQIVVCGNLWAQDNIEECNGYDDDCDNLIDEGNVCPAVCGNSIIEPGEQCDDGNVINGDGCSSQCRIEPDRDNDGVPDVRDTCPNSKPGEDVDQNGCDPFQFCSSKPSCGSGCTQADFKNNEGDNPNDCTFVIIEKTLQPKCVPTTCAN